MTQTSLPAARAAFIDQNGRPTPEFYRFLETLATAQAGNVSPDEITAINAQLAELQAEIAALPSAEIPKLQATYPILSQGLLQNGFAKLALDQPGDSGTGALKGITLDAWGRVTGTTDGTITGTAGRVTVTNGNAAAGVPTIDLATVADTGGGSLLKFVRDAWGRITGTSTPTTTDLAEGSNLYFTAARVLATVLAGLSTATNAVITAADSVLVALGKLQAQITANVTALAGKLAKSANLSDVANAATALANLGALALPDPGYINGLQMAWVSATQVTVSSGAAYIQSAGSILQVPATITVTFSGLAASTWYHLYLYNNAGTAAIEYSTTAPASPYNGTARAKTGDTSRRYVGSVLTDSNGNVYNFSMNGARCNFLVASNTAPFRVLLGGAATTSTNVDCSTAIPVTATHFWGRLLDASGAGITTYMGNPDMGAVSSTNAVVGIGPGNIAWIDFPVSANLQFNYLSTPSAGSLGVDIGGFIFER